jgi:tetratricopeptide (TPR) repeat protein/tRNA A-37 threonylcarbamoyl transferase component Bud32
VGSAFALRVGDVLAGKYRLLELHRADGATASFRAQDPHGRVVEVEVLADGRTPPPGSGIDCGTTPEGLAYVVFDRGNTTGRRAESVAIPPSLTPDPTAALAPFSPLAHTSAAKREFVGLVEGEVFAERYRVDQCIGRGGMGEVYRARDQKLNRIVALKLVRYANSDESTSRRASELLIREARAAATLSHPNVVTVFDAGEVSGTHYLAMEYVEGRPLRGSIGDGSIPLETRARWLVEIATALAAAHAKGIVHRDVKPENAMITSAGAAKVLDFGIAKEVSASGVTQDGMIVGSPLYMSPEAMYGADVDGRCDQYSWALVAHEVLTGRHPFARPLSGATGMSADLPPPFDAVISRALSQHPEARFASMDEVLCALHDKAPAPAATPRRRWWRRVAVAAALAGLAIASGLALRHRPTVPLTEAARPDAAPAGFDERAMDGQTVTRCAPSARPAFAAGLQLWRDASQADAVAKFDQAAEADPQCAAPSVYYLLAASQTYPRRREHFRRARDLRASLTERETAILQALEPALADPVDYEEVVRRTTDLLTRIPNDPDVRRLNEQALFRLGRFGDVIAAVGATSAISLKPIAWNERMGAMAEVRVRDTDRAFAHLRDCLQVSPDSSDCLFWKGMLEGSMGQCDAAEATYRQLATVMPENSDAYSYLGQVFLLAPKPDMAAAREAFEQRWHRLALTPGAFMGEPADAAQTADEFRMALASGKLEGALALARKWNEAVSGSTDGRFRLEPLIYVINILRELDRLPEARALALEGLGEQRAWTGGGHERVDSFIELARLAYLTGGIDASRFRQIRGEWAGHGLHSKLDIWLNAYAGLPEVGSDEAPPFAEGEYAQDWFSFYQETYARAAEQLTALGQHAAAIRHADAAVGACLASYPITGILHARVAQARAYDASGNVPAACAAYRSLVGWLGREPRSVSARFAKDQLGRLSCSSHFEESRNEQ